MTWIDEVAYAAQLRYVYPDRCYAMRLIKGTRQSEAVDFDDLIMLTLCLFDQHPDVLTTAEVPIHPRRRASRYNHAQYQLVKLLAYALKISVSLGMRPVYLRLAGW